MWIEDGLAANTLAAYRRDLTLYATWLQREGTGSAIERSRESDLLAYMAARHAGSRATSANRRLTVFKRFFRWALRERLTETDPTLKLRNARQPLRMPKSLSRGAGRGAARLRPTWTSRWACATGRCSNCCTPAACVSPNW